MPEDVPCDICQQSHEEAIGPLERDQSYGDATESTGSTIIQDARRRAYSELARFREDLVVVRGSCLLCRAIGEGWEHDFKSCYRRADVFHERKQARIRHESKGRKWLQPYTACFWCHCATASSSTLQAQIGCPRGLIDDSGPLKPFSTGLERNAILEVVELFKQSESQQKH
jgi:hypothetical protein